MSPRERWEVEKGAVGRSLAPGEKKTHAGSVCAHGSWGFVFYLRWLSGLVVLFGESCMMSFFASGFKMSLNPFGLSQVFYDFTHPRYWWKNPNCKQKLPGETKGSIIMAFVHLYPCRNELQQKKQNTTVCFLLNFCSFRMIWVLRVKKTHM